MHRQAKTAATAALVMAAALAAVTGCGDDGSIGQPSPTPPATASTAPSPSASAPSAASTPPSPSQPAPTARFEVRGHKLAAGPRTVDAKLGSEVIIEVVADAADELHVHGYDKKAKVVANTPTRIVFPATIAGVFEVELHSGVKLCELRVR